MTEPWCKQEDRAWSTVVRYGQKEGCNVLIGDVRRTDKRRPACSCLVTDALHAHIVHWWCVLCTEGRMKVLLHSTPAFFLFSQSSPLSGPAGCSNVKRRKLLYNTAVKTWTVASGANMWRRQIGGTPNWTPGPRIVDSGHVDIVIKHPQTLGRVQRGIYWDANIDANPSVCASRHNLIGSSPPSRSS